MFVVFEPVIPIYGGKLSRFQDQKIFGVQLLRCLVEIERSGHNKLAINDNDAIIGHGMDAIQEDRDTGIGHDGRRRKAFLAIGFVDDNLDTDTSFVGVDKGLSQDRRSDGISLDEDLRSCFDNLLTDGFGTSTLRAETDQNRHVAAEDEIVSVGKMQGEEYCRDNGQTDDKGKFSHVTSPLRCYIYSWT